MNNRKHERVRVSVEATMDAGVSEQDPMISNLSLGGCYVESTTDLRPGEPVSFNLVDQNGGTIGFTGEIAHVISGKGFGLQFTNLGPDQIGFLNRSISEGN